MERPPLQRFRDDRRKLLDFIFSSGLIKQVQAAGEVEVDSISVDYVLDCINSGGVFDPSEASNKYKHESSFPIMIESPSGSSYFNCSYPELSGSPPRRAPPEVDFNPKTDSSLQSSNQLETLFVEEMPNHGDEDGFTDIDEAIDSCQPVKDANIPSLELPILRTGLSDDALRETAYELFLGSLVTSGFHLHSLEDRKKEKKSRLLSKLKSKKEKISSQSQIPQSHQELLEIVRTQMQISETMDACIRQSLIQLASSTVHGEIDVPQVSLELLNGICKYNFSSEKSYIQWKKRQANILEELLCASANRKKDEYRGIRNMLAMIRTNDQWDISISPLEHAEVMLAIRNYVSKLSSVPGKFGIPGETIYWTSGYHLNIKLYEKLLSCVFDILDEGQLVEEADEILSLMKLSWVALGITQKIHHALYGWLLFRQFVETGEIMLLDHAIIEIQKVVSSGDNEGKEGAYINSLVCSIVINGSKLNLNLVDAVFMLMSVWCDSKLKDYHLHFNQEPMNFKRVLNLFILVGMLAADGSGKVKLTRPKHEPDIAATHIKEYMEKSVRAACRRLSSVIDTFSNRSKAERKHPLAMLADQVRLIAEKESTVFVPALCKWSPEAGTVSSMVLHEFYGEKLKPFLDGVSGLSEDVIMVLPAAAMLEWDLSHIYYSALAEHKLHPISNKKLNHYQIGEISGPILLEWLSTQHVHILEWTDRAFDVEDWEPLSYHQRQAASIIEVFRIIEEAVDQLFGLKLPMDVKHLKYLLSIISQCLEGYVLKMVNQLVEKSHLFPAAPALTRYEETMIPIIKKKSIFCMVLEDEVLDKLNELTVPKLCVRLNTLHYIQNQIDTLEDGIRKTWTLVRPCAKEKWAKEQFLGHLEERLPTCCKSIDGLFNIFNRIRKSASDAINKFCDFIGARIVFWDLRQSYLFHLYRGTVESTRLESSLPQIDTVLDHICSVISDTLRDLVVLSIYRASLDGYVWVLLDGGPSRVFSELDVEMMQEDLNILKEFFVADGEGLPPAVVDHEAQLPQQILQLYSLQTETLIGMLMGASEHISSISDTRELDDWCVEDAYTLLRVLCHKKDFEASKFLKRHYQLPRSSEYEDSPLDSTVGSTLVTDLLKRSTSFHWTKKSQRSFKSIKKKLQEASSEIMH